MADWDGMLALPSGARGVFHAVLLRVVNRMRLVSVWQSRWRLPGQHLVEHVECAALHPAVHQSIPEQDQ
jgi:hypothetical protein